MVPDAVHAVHPFHLVGCFEPFSDTLGLVTLQFVANTILLVIDILSHRVILLCD